MARVTRRTAASGAALVATAAVAFWAGHVAASPSDTHQAMPPSDVVVDVTTGELGRSLTLSTTVTQDRTPIATNTLPGVVTEVTGAGTVPQGGVLYRVADIPVRAVQGRTPFYRPLKAGMVGADVRQLSEALVAAKLLPAASNTFDEATAEAVKKWQTNARHPANGEVSLGELVAVPRLPGAVTLDQKVVRPGLVLAGGEQAVLAPAGEPQFTLVLGSEQASLVPTDATIVVQHDKREWPAIIASTRKDDSGQTVHTLTSPTGGNVCGTQCGELDAAEQQSLMARVQVTKPAKGSIVPVSAILTGADGASRVVVVGKGADQNRPVTIVATQNGMAVVTGVEKGDRVRALAAEQPK